MPHVIVKLWPGKTEQQKTRLAEAITRDVMDILRYGEESVSVAMEEVKSQDWVQHVYKPDIQDFVAVTREMPNSRHNDAMLSPSFSRSTKRMRSSTMDRSFHGIV